MHLAPARGMIREVTFPHLLRIGLPCQANPRTSTCAYTVGECVYQPSTAWRNFSSPEMSNIVQLPDKCVNDETKRQLYEKEMWEQQLAQLHVAVNPWPNGTLGATPDCLLFGDDKEFAICTAHARTVARQRAWGGMRWKPLRKASIGQEGFIADTLRASVQGPLDASNA